jgi:tetratricopeptide (TPR) repeat protein
MILRYLYFIILLVLPGIVFSQSIPFKELQAFTKIKNGNYSEAIDSLNIILSKNPEPEVHLAKAEAFLKLGNFSEALEECKRIEKIRPFYSSELEFKIFLTLNDHEKANEALEENLKSKYKISLFDLLNNPEFSNIYNLGLDKTVLTGNFYSQTEKQLYQAERLIHQEKHNQALFIINEIISRNNNIAQAHYLKSRITYIEGDIQNSLQSINTAIELKKSEIKYFTHRLLINKELEKLDDALTDATKLIRLAPYEIDNYINKADLLFKTKQFDEGIELTNAILKILPEDPDVLYLSSKSFFMKNDYFEALKNINQALQIKSNIDFYELRGDIYMATNTFEYATRDYSMCLDIEAQNGTVYAKKGLARLKLGDKKGACSDWKKGKRYGSYDAISYLEKYCQ